MMFLAAVGKSSPYVNNILKSNVFQVLSLGVIGSKENSFYTIGNSVMFLTLFLKVFIRTASQEYNGL